MLNLQRHQSRKNGISRILRGGGKNAVVELFAVESEKFGQHIANGQPLVEAEVVDDHKKDLFALIDEWENVGFEEVGTHGWTLGATFEPKRIISFDEFCENAVGLGLLHG